MGIEDVKKLFAAWAQVMLENRDRLIDMDSVAGDGDLGLTMTDGFAAASKTVDASAEADLGKTVYQAGKAFGSAAPSSLGTLFAAGFMSAGMALKGKTELDTAAVAAMIRAFADGIARLGKAKEGEKTVLDALYPAGESARSGGCRRQRAEGSAGVRRAGSGTGLPRHGGYARGARTNRHTRRKVRRHTGPRLGGRGTDDANLRPALTAAWDMTHNFIS